MPEISCGPLAQKVGDPFLRQIHLSGSIFHVLLTVYGNNRGHFLNLMQLMQPVWAFKANRGAVFSPIYETFFSYRRAKSKSCDHPIEVSSKSRMCLLRLAFGTRGEVGKHCSIQSHPWMLGGCVNSKAFIFSS